MSENCGKFRQISWELCLPVALGTRPGGGTEWFTAVVFLQFSHGQLGTGALKYVVLKFREDWIGLAENSCHCSGLPLFWGNPPTCNIPGTDT